jgi:hypothetical protein
LQENVSRKSRMETGVTLLVRLPNRSTYTSVSTITELIHRPCVMGTRDGAWTGVRYRGSGFLFWVRLAIEIVRIDRNHTDHIGSHFLVK